VNLRQNRLLHKKWAPRAHFAKPVKCGTKRIAAHTRFRGCALGSSEQNRDRAVVDELDSHPRAEHACGDLDAEPAQLSAERLVERLGLPGRGGVREARPVALRRVGDQRELADDQRRAADVQQRAVEPPLALEDPQAGDLASEPLRVGGRVAARDAKEDAQARADLAARRDARARNPLDDGFQPRSITRAA
jgi:hypothetical protein